jgi:predicted regulator of Ras-like GTPase activity (Roadblock/LC7/MglB family)
MTNHQSGSTEVTARKARSLLRTLQATSDTVRSCALVTYDGLMLAAVMSEGIDADRFGAMCASLLALSARATKEVERGTLRQIILDGDKGPILLTRAGTVGVLAVAADPSPNLGKLILDTRATAKALALLDAPESPQS